MAVGHNQRGQSGVRAHVDTIVDNRVTDKGTLLIAASLLSSACSSKSVKSPYLCPYLCPAGRGSGTRRAGRGGQEIADAAVCGMNIKRERQCLSKSGSRTWGKKRGHHSNAINLAQHQP